MMMKGTIIPAYFAAFGFDQFDGDIHVLSAVFKTHAVLPAAIKKGGHVKRLGYLKTQCFGLYIRVFEYIQMSFRKSVMHLGQDLSAAIGGIITEKETYRPKADIKISSKTDQFYATNRFCMAYFLKHFGNLVFEGLIAAPQVIPVVHANG